jgi:hypothetical protein
MAITLPIALYRGRHRVVGLSEAPFIPGEAAQRQVIILGWLATLGVTATVLLVTFASNRGDTNSDTLNAVLTMFITSYMAALGAALQLTWVPRAESEGAARQRLHLCLANTQMNRTIYLGWFALHPLMETFSLVQLAAVLEWLLGATLLMGVLVIASLHYRLGVLTVREALLWPLAGFIGALAYGVLVHFAVPAAHSPITAFYLTVVFFLLAGFSFSATFIAAMLTRESAVGRLIDRYGRLFVMADNQGSLTMLAFLYLAVLGVI